MLLLASLSLATAALALLVSRATITEALREAAPPWLQKGLRCPFCCSGWVAGTLVLGYGPLHDLPFALAWLAVWGGAAVATGLAERY